MGIFWVPDRQWLNSLEVGEEYIGFVKTLSGLVKGRAVIGSITVERGVKIYRWELTINGRTSYYVSAEPNECTFPKTKV